MLLVGWDISQSIQLGLVHLVVGHRPHNVQSAGPAGLLKDGSHLQTRHAMLPGNLDACLQTQMAFLLATAQPTLRFLHFR